MDHLKHIPLLVADSLSPHPPLHMGSFTDLLNQLKQSRANAFASSASPHQSPTSQAIPSYGAPPFPAQRAGPGSPQANLLDILRPCADSPFDSPRDGQGSPDTAGLRWGQAAAPGAVPAHLAVGHTAAATRQNDTCSQIMMREQLEPLPISQWHAHEYGIHALCDVQERALEQGQQHVHHIALQLCEEEHADVATGGRMSTGAAAAGGRAALSRSSSVGSCSNGPCAGEKEGEGEECESWETDSLSSWEFDDLDSEEEEEEEEGGEDNEEGEEREEDKRQGGRDWKDVAVSNVMEANDEGKQKEVKEWNDGSRKEEDGGSARVNPDRSFEVAAIMAERRQEGQEGCVPVVDWQAISIMSLLKKRKAVREGNEGMMTDDAMRADALQAECFDAGGEQGRLKRPRV